MFCIIYRSTANPTIGRSQILDILEQARDFNLSKDITGCLLSHNHEFVHYLEGEKSIVEALFQKIRIDRRHTKIVLLYHGHINGREFGNWSMAYESFSGQYHRSEYHKLLINAYFENDDTNRLLEPTTKKFWVTVRKLLATPPMENSK